MSESLYAINNQPIGGLRFWSEAEIDHREECIRRLSSTLKTTLRTMNAAWDFRRCEGPILTPPDQISSSYTEDDVFSTDFKEMKLRAETTASSYAYARWLMNSHLPGKPKLPLCVWQVGKSFRKELVDGATAGKLRFNEFYQLEFQCIYSANTKADYRSVVVPAIAKEIVWLTASSDEQVPHYVAASRIIESDRLPSYSERTDDIEVQHNDRWREMASISTRTDFSDDVKVLEVAIGLDRLVSVFFQNRET